MTVTLYHGDCLEILPTLPDKSVDAIITDLPYGTTACKWDVIIPLALMWEQVKRLCKGAFVTTASQPFTSVLVASNLDWFKCEWIWLKNNSGGFANVDKQPLKYHENIVVFANGQSVYNPQFEEYSESSKKRFGKNPIAKASPKNINNIQGIPNATHIYNFERGTYPKSYQYITGVPVYGDERCHPSQKPVALYEYLIRTYTNEGDTVIDFCMGSGTTGVACVKTGRNFIGIEKEQGYFEIAQKRIKQAEMQMVLL